MKFVADESVDFRLIKFLRESGFEVHAIIKERPSIDDEKVLLYAFTIKAILLTEDKDFGELTFRLRKPNYGIILLRLRKMTLSEKKDKLLDILQKFDKQLHNKFTVITPDKIRIKNQT